jgi:hypothetical protein
MKIELNLTGITQIYNMLIVNSLPIPEASDPKTLYRLKTGGEMFVSRLKAKWVKVNSGIKTVNVLPDVRYDL